MKAFVEAARQVARSIVWSPGSRLYPTYGSFAGHDLHWRHHGLGMLQAEFSDNLRIHVWHPKLVVPEMAWPRCVHDHRFDITSAVLVGSVIDVPCHVIELDVTYCLKCKVRPDEPERIGVECPQHDWVTPTLPDATRVNVYEIEHAKNQDRLVTEKGCSTATSAKKLFHAGLYERKSVRQMAGSEYTIARREFHTTRVDALAVTVMHRSNFDARLARVLCAPDSDVTAISGIVRDESAAHAALVAHVLDEASSAIARMGDSR